jgi:hypothetical protein
MRSGNYEFGGEKAIKEERLNPLRMEVHEKRKGCMIITDYFI